MDEVIIEGPSGFQGQEGPIIVGEGSSSIPGANQEAAEIIVMPGSDSVYVEEDDPWDWEKRPRGEFCNWARERSQNVPSHTGRDSTGCERAISHFDRILKEISRAMRSDYDQEIDASEAEGCRVDCENGKSMLQDRLDMLLNGRKKAAFTKEAQKATAIHGITVTVPMLIATIARICINGTVSAGHNIQDMFEKLTKEYKLDDRETLTLVQLLLDMGWAVRRDRGIALDKPTITTSPFNFDYQANYTA